MPPTPQNPDPKFDFMLKNQGQAKRRLGLPHLSKPLKIGLAVIGAIILLIIINSLLSGRSSGATTAIDGVLARGQETLRVTQAVQQLNLQDPTTQALAATVTSGLTSDQQLLENYLADSKAKVSPAQLAADADKSTDSQMQSASQNNNLDQTYVTYLRQSLAKYQAELQTAYKAAGPKGKTILKNSFDSITTLLNNPPLKT
jgi:hypothetical protein